MSDHQFIRSYLEDFSDLLRPNEELIEKLIQIRDLLLEVNKNNKKILIFGNGGSASIASHFSVDLTKNAKLRCLNFNESDLITCFANDYGFEHWVEKTIDFYGDEGDLLIVISSSGQSENMLNAVSAARNGNFHSVVTLTGFSEANPFALRSHILSICCNAIEELVTRGSIVETSTISGFRGDTVL